LSISRHVETINGTNLLDHDRTIAAFIDLIKSKFRGV